MSVVDYSREGRGLTRCEPAVPLGDFHLGFGDRSEPAYAMVMNGFNLIRRVLRDERGRPSLGSVARSKLRGGAAKRKSA